MTSLPDSAPDDMLKRKVFHAVCVVLQVDEEDHEETEDAVLVTDAIMAAIRAAIQSALPEKRELPPINAEWNEPWMHVAGGVSEYNTAISEIEANLKKKGLLE
jgi:hypothetical protein